MNELRVKRVYEAKDEADGMRILVDRLWPRGITKADAKLDAWIRAVAPSTELRKAFHGGNLSFDDFKARLIAGLEANDQAKAFKAEIRGILEKRNVTLLFSAKDTEHNNAVVLRDWILD